MDSSSSSSSSQVVVQKQQEEHNLLLGKPLKRTEDQKFVTGTGRYVDDIKFPNGLFAAFIRSPHAHARVLKVDTSAALAACGVVGALDGRAIDGLVKDMPSSGSGNEGEGGSGEGGMKRRTVRKALAIDRVRYAGEPVAVVLAESYYAAQDAAELVQVEYDPLPAVVDPEAALRSGSPKVHEEFPDNVGYHLIHHHGDMSSAFRRADEVIKVKLINQRVHPVSLEPRGLAAAYDEGNDSLTVWLSTQDPHGLRDEIAKRLRMQRAKVRVIAPDTGGGFGGKGAIYPEDIVVCFAAKRFRRPVKWEETRREHMLTMNHGRGQVQWAELAVRRDGKILGLKTKLILDGGAYTTSETTGIPELTVKMGTGVYDIPAYHAELMTAFTNKVPHGAYRGAGRPEAAYLIERSMNILAAKLKLDPVKVRRINYVKKEQFPFKTPGGYTYDSGDYDANLTKALRVSNYEKLREEQREARAAGRLVGIGLVTWVEICGFAPDTGQTSAITVSSDGRVTITIGGHPHGQGHAVAVSQIVADELGIGIDSITVRHGDTDMLPWSSVTAGSRSAALTGSATLICARKVREKMARIAAHALKLGETTGTTMVFRDGKIFPEGNRSKAISFEAVADKAYDAEAIPPGMEPTIFEYTAFAPSNYLFPFGTHIAMVEVDRETGEVKVLKYFAVDDCGKLLNPMLVEGQVHGGIAQGLGQAMLEELVYDENGQLLTSTLADYSIPSADDIPEIVWDHTETPTDVNPLGVKGIGEAGTIASTPALVNAAEDALAQYGVVVDRMPLRSDYVLSLIKRAGRS